MENFVINGGKELFGEVNISGAKNAAVEDELEKMKKEMLSFRPQFWRMML